MKVGVISDIHGATEVLMRIKDALNACDAVYFLGDGIADIKRVSPYLNTRIVSVRGNNDFADSLPQERVEDVNGTKVYLTHGHLQNVKSGLLTLFLRAKELNCSFAVYGHTHAAAIEEHDGITLLNPGSLRYPRIGRATYAVLDSDEKGVFGKIVMI